jgi:hypothetical protein
VDPVLALSDPQARVDPGGEARLQVSVRNVGDLVEQYQFEVLGDAARWAQVLPRQVSVLPHGQEEKTVEVVFRPPPAPAAPAGDIPFGVRCVSLERRDRCAVVEGDVAVGAVHNLTARLEPVTPRGRWTGRYRIRFDNTGSVPVTLALDAGDTKQRLRFALAPRELTVAPGRSAAAYLAVRPRQPMTRGKAVEHPFVLSYRATTDAGSGELSGSFEQRPIISKGVLALGVLVVGLAAGAGALLLRTGSGQQKAALSTDGPPPPTVLTSAERLTDASAQIVWERSPYATGYVVQQLANGKVSGSKEVADPDQSTVVWPGLKPGKTCFQVITVGKAGRSAPSEPRCVTLAAPRPPATPSSTTPAPAPTSAPATGGPGGPGGGGPGGGGTTGPSGGPGGAVVLQGFYVIYAVVPQDDAASQGTAERVVHQLQQAGVQARLIDSKASEQLADGNAGLWYVLQDGFATFAAGRAECAARHNIPGAENCFVAP